MKSVRVPMVCVVLAASVIAGNALGDDPTTRGVPPPSSITQLAAPPLTGATAEEEMTADLTYGTNVCVNANTLSLTRPQLEPSVASNPANPQELVAGFADYVADAEPGVSRSTDGGRTWAAPAGGSILPNPPGFSWGSRTAATGLAGGDSAIAWGLGEVVYFSTLGFHNNATAPNNDCSSGGIYVYRSDDGGNTWKLPTNGTAINNTQTVFRDKEYIAADTSPLSPFAGRVYMVWDDDNYSGCPQNFPQNFTQRSIVFSRSSDDGATWAAQTSLATGCLVGAIPTVAANGDVFVVWFDCNAGNRQMVRKSTDGGASFQPAVAAASGLTQPPNPLVGSAFRVNAPFPAIATDPTNPENVYATWSSNNGSNQTDVFVSRSTDGGTSWSPAPIRVNDDPPGNPHDQFFPSIAVSAGGTVRVAWGDDRLDLSNPGGKLYDLFAAESTDAGASFGTNVRVSTQSSNPDLDGFGGAFLGDYWGMAATGVPVWADERSGNQDIFGAPAPSPCTPTPATDCLQPAAPGSVVQLKANANPKKKSLTWNWSKGAATTLADFGNPTTSTTYTLCVYDGTAGVVVGATAPGGGTCGTKPCWSATKTGFKYTKNSLIPDGLRQIQLTAGATGKAKITVKGKGAPLGLPGLPLAQTAPVIVQLINSNGTCWEADYSSPASRNDAAQFKDTSD